MQALALFLYSYLLDRNLHYFLTFNYFQLQVSYCSLLLAFDLPIASKDPNVHSSVAITPIADVWNLEPGKLPYIKAERSDQFSSLCTCRQAIPEDESHLAGIPGFPSQKQKVCLFATPEGGETCDSHGPCSSLIKLCF